MGAIAELTAEELGVVMDFNSYGDKGDRSKPDGWLGDTPVICKAVGPGLSKVWVPMVCLRNAMDGIVLAVRVSLIPLNTCIEGSIKEESLIPWNPRIQELRYARVVLGWEWTEQFLRDGMVDDRHKRLMESVPGKALDRDICVTYPVSLLRPV